MPQFSELSDEELGSRILHCSGPIQQGMIVELQRRQAAKTQTQLSQIQEQMSNIRGEVSTVHAHLSTLGKSHKVHLWILWVAIATALLALIAALDVILKWIRER